MKKQLFIITVLVFSVLPSTVLFSQSSTVNFVYDRNGNRYSRQLVIVEETRSDFVASDGSLDAIPFRFNGNINYGATQVGSNSRLKDELKKLLI